MTRSKIFTYVMLVVGFGAAAYLLYHTFREYSFSDITESFSAIPTVNLVTAFGFAAAVRVVQAETKLDDFHPESVFVFYFVNLGARSLPVF